MPIFIVRDVSFFDEEDERLPVPLLVTFLLAAAGKVALNKEGEAGKMAGDTFAEAAVDTTGVADSAFIATNMDARESVLAERLVPVAVAQDVRGPPNGLLETAAAAPPATSADVTSARAIEIRL